MKDKITKQTVESLKPVAKDRFLWDSELPMFGCKITPKGRRVYLLQYRIKRRSRRFTIGTHGVLSAGEARHIARNLLHEVVLGHDPADTKNNKGDQTDGKNQNSSQGRKQQVVKFKTPHIRGNLRKSAAKANKAAPVSPEPVVNKTKSVSSGEKPEIPGYSLEEIILDGNQTVLYRGKRQSDGLLVLIKGAASSQQSAQELAEIRHEHEIIRDLEIDGVLRAEELAQCENGWALILENTEGLPLRKLMDAARFDLLDSLKVAVSLTSTLEEVHRQGILHKMINPFNIFVDPASGNIKLTGFGLAIRLPRENPTTLSPQLSGETLPYISPEQTGRMNRVLDYRSDFYSLGATLYELFSGRVPFQSREAMEIIHAHIARQPVPPDQMAPQVPKTLSNIVMKLLAKRAEARYQSHSGLAADLLACVEQLEKQGSLSDFPLGRHDVPKELQIAPGLYGREDEITALEAALERVSQGATEMVLISGSAGVGKTALVGEIHRSIAQKNGFFLSGKFDQLRHNIPYSALIQALRGLIREISVARQIRNGALEKQDTGCPGTQWTTGDPGDPGTGTGDRPATPVTGNGSAGVPQPLHCRFTGIHRPFL